MDLIKENAPSEIPETAEESIARRKAEELEPMSPRYLFLDDRGSLPCENKVSLTMPCTMEFLKLLVNDLEVLSIAIRLCPLDALKEKLMWDPVELLEEISRLHFNHELFPDDSARLDFFGRVKLHLKTMKRWRSIAAKLTKAFEEGERVIGRDEFRRNAEVIKRKTFVPWADIHRSDVIHFDRAKAQEATRTKSKLFVLAQSIPQGALLILDRWRFENERIIAEIEEVCPFAVFLHCLRQLTHICRELGTLLVSKISVPQGKDSSLSMVKRTPKSGTRLRSWRHLLS